MAEEKNSVLEALKKADKPLKSAEIIEMTSLDKKVVSKWIKELKNSGEIYSPKNCYYEIKK